MLIYGAAFVAALANPLTKRRMEARDDRVSQLAFATKLAGGAKFTLKKQTLAPLMGHPTI